jgi:hypothetical protein
VPIQCSDLEHKRELARDPNYEPPDRDHSQPNAGRY